MTNAVASDPHYMLQNASAWPKLHNSNCISASWILIISSCRKKSANLLAFILPIAKSVRIRFVPFYDAKHLKQRSKSTHKTHFFKMSHNFLFNFGNFSTSFWVWQLKLEPLSVVESVDIELRKLEFEDWMLKTQFWSYNLKN